MRVRLATEGHRPYRVSVYVERGRVWCLWGTSAGRKFKSWIDSGANRKTALKWARQYAAERMALAKRGGEAPPEPSTLTLRALWDRYRAANAKDWRAKTAKDYGAYFAVLDDVIGAQKPIASLTLEDVDGFKAARRDAGIAHSQVRRQIGFLRQMCNWAESRELLAVNRLRAYRYVIPKDEQGEPPAEYHRADLLKIAAQLAGPRHWRARGVIALCGTLGARINAVLHLQWADVDLDTGRVTWRKAWDKLGKERVQPLTPRAQAALVECFGQRHESEPWVFWAVRAKGRPYHYNAVHHHLREAERRAGVAHLEGRAFHGLRRMVVGDVGDLRDAGAWVGQKSLKVTAGYDRTREEQVERARERITKIEGA